MSDAIRVTLAKPGESALRVTGINDDTITYVFHTLTTANSARSNRVLDTTTYLDAATRHYTGSYFFFERDVKLPAQFECIVVQTNGGAKHYLYPFVRFPPPHDYSDNDPSIMNFNLPAGIKNHIFTDYPDATVVNPVIVCSIPGLDSVSG